MLTCRLSGQHFRPCWSLPGSSCPWRSVLTPDAAEVSAHGRQAPPLAKARSCGQLVRLLITAKDAHAKRYSTRYSRVVTQRSTDLAQSSLPSVIGRERGYSGWYDRSMEDPRFGDAPTSSLHALHPLDLIPFWPGRRAGGASCYLQLTLVRTPPAVAHVRGACTIQ